MENTTGDRVRRVRKRRGMTQREFAAATGLSLSWVKQIEQGASGDLRLETVRKMAVALRVPTTTLITGPDREISDQATTDEWEPVRQALAGLSAPLGAQATAEGVTAATAAIRPAVAANRFTGPRAALAALIRDADTLSTEDEPSRQARFRALNMTGWVLTQMRQWDTATDALDLAADAATTAMDAASVEKTRIWLLLRQGELAAARDTAVRWADEIEPRISRATGAELSLWGHLQLNIANAAIRDNRPGEAHEALRRARAAGDLIGREIMSDPSTTRVFGPATVAYSRAEIYAIDGQPDKTLAIDGSIPRDVFAAADMTRLRHELDVASALTQMRRYPEAITVMQETRAAAPEWLPQQRYARDILGRIIDRRRTLTPDMRALADAVRLPL